MSQRLDSIAAVIPPLERELKDSRELQKSMIKDVVKRSIYQFRQIKQKSEIPRMIRQIMIQTEQNLNYVYCNICQQKFLDSQTESIGQCQHKYCQECCYGYLVYKLNNRQQIMCPEETCSSLFKTQSSLYRRFSEKDKKAYKQTQSLLRLKTDNNCFICPGEDCRQTISMGENKCKKCNTQICIKCFLIKHQGECINYQAQKLKQFYVRCKRCHIPIQKFGGCDHIICICNYEFCYQCGQPWLGHICLKFTPWKKLTEWQRLIFIVRVIILFIWSIVAGIFGILLYLLLSLLLGPIFHYSQMGEKSNLDFFQYIYLVAIIPGILYGQYLSLKLQISPISQWIIAYINFFKQSSNYLLHN